MVKNDGFVIRHTNKTFAIEFLKPTTALQGLNPIQIQTPEQANQGVESTWTLQVSFKPNSTEPWFTASGPRWFRGTHLVSCSPVEKGRCGTEEGAVESAYGGGSPSHCESGCAPRPAPIDPSWARPAWGWCCGSSSCWQVTPWMGGRGKEGRG